MRGVFNSITETFPSLSLRFEQFTGDSHQMRELSMGSKNMAGPKKGPDFQTIHSELLR
jgi:hypothetical protein